MPGLYLEPDPAGRFTTDYATGRPADGSINVLVPARIAPVPTLEATHTWDGSLQLHDHRELGDVDWRLRCRRISLGSMPAAVLPSTPRVGGTGTIGRRGTIGGRIVTYSGAIEAVDAAALREASAALLAIGWDQDGDREITIDQDDAGWTFSGRATPDVADNTALSLNAVPTPYQAEFTVAVQMNDPRIYGPLVEDRTVIGAPPAADAAKLPWPRLPVVLRPPTPASGSGEIEILGKIPTPIVIRLHGPRSEVTLTDLDRDVRVVLDVDIPAGTYVDVDFRTAAVTTEDGEDITAAVRWPDSTWWLARNLAVSPGPLHLQVASAVAGDGANVDVLHHPAFP
jgi:hypothetical protein